MPKEADEYIVYQKKSHNSIGWYVLYRDVNGNRMSALSLAKIKKEVIADKKKSKMPIKDKMEAMRIAEKGLLSETIYNKINNRQTNSPLFSEYVNMIWDFDNSPYFISRRKENNLMLRSSCEKNISAFNKHIVHD